MSNEKIMTSRGEVVAIGEFKPRNSKEFPYEIPRLSFIIVQDSIDTYTSTCIDLHIDGDGVSQEEAAMNMGENVFEFLRVNFKGNRANGAAWDYLNELFDIDDNSRELWNTFSRFRISLSKRGKRTDFASELMEHINMLRREIYKLASLHKSKDHDLKEMRSWLNKQKEAIDLLNKDNQRLNEVVARFVVFQTIRNSEPRNIRKT